MTDKKGSREPPRAGEFQEDVGKGLRLAKDGEKSRIARAKGRQLPQVNADLCSYPARKKRHLTTPGLNTLNTHGH